MRKWLVGLIREAIHAELSERLRDMETQLRMLEVKESKLATITAGEIVKRKPRPRTWSEYTERLDQEVAKQ